MSRPLLADTSVDVDAIAEQIGTDTIFRNYSN